MGVRNVLALILPFIILACGGDSTPTAPTRSQGPLNVIPGAYGLTLTMSLSGEPVCNSGLCISVSLCAGADGPPSVTTLATVVRLDRTGDDISIRPEDASATFRIDLHVAGNALGGTASGQFRDDSRQVFVGPGDGRATAVATATMLTASVAGKLDGQVSIGGYSCSNNGHTWTLTPR